MRNLKRALSLLLSSTMVLGMLVMGSSAASYQDVNDSYNQEAIEVLQAVGVMTGDENGNFNPDAKVTRNEMAVVMANLLKLDYEYYTGATTSFTDVPEWAEKYVAACQANGIISGYSETTFGGSDNVTAAQAALMMMKALGYFQYAPDFGDDWQLSTVKQASKIDLYDGINAGATAALTRNEIAQLVLNTLKADMVEFNGSVGTNITTSDGTSVTVGYVAKYDPYAAPAGANYNNATAGSHDAVYRQLVEELFGDDLKLTHPDDAMNRVSNKWTYKTQVVGNYAQTPDYTFVVGKAQTAEELIKDELGKNITQPGAIASVNGGTEGTTAALNLKVGDTVEIYMNDTAAETVAVVAVTRYSVDRLTADVGTKGEGDDLEVRLPGTAMSSYRPADEVVGYEGLKKDDVIYYYQDNDNVYHVFKAESFDGKLTSIKNQNPYTYVVDGEDYIANGNLTPEAMNIAAPVFNTEYRFWVDNNGYVVYGDELEDALSDYVVIQDMKYVGVDANSALGDTARVEARLVKMDGTTQVVTINSIVSYASGKTCKWMGSTSANNNAAANSDAASTGIQGRYLVVDTAGTPSLNGTVAGFVDDMFFTYTINSDGEYDLTYVNGTDVAVTEISDSGITLTAGKVFDGTNTIPVTDDTVFVVAKTSNGTKFDVYTGKNNAPDLTTAKGAYVTEDGVVTYMYIDAYTGSTFSGNTLFIMDDSPIAYYEVKKDDGTKYGYNTYKAAVNGVYEEVKIAASSLSTVTATGAPVAVDFFSPTYNEDGVITSLTAATNDQPMAYGYKLTGTTLVTGKTYGSATYANAYVCENDVPVFYMDEDGDVSELTAADLSNDANDQIYVVTTNNTDNKVKFLVIMEKDADETGISLSASDGTLTAAGSYVETIDGVAQTVTKYTLNSTSGTVSVVTEAGAKVEYDTSSPYWDTMTTYTGTAITNPGSVGNWFAIKVTAEDTSVAYYAIEVIA